MDENIEQPDELESITDEIEIVDDIDSDEADLETDSGVDDELDEVDYEGKQYKVPKELKDALLRQADYTRKTQEVAQQRQAVEQQRQQAEQAIQLVSQFQKEYAELSAIDSQLDKLSKLDWNAAINENPVEAMKLQARFNELRMAKDTLTSNISNIQQTVQQQRQAELARAVAEGEATLQRDIPNWGVETKQAIAAAAKSFGFTDADLQGIADPRIIKVLHAAMMHEQGKQKLQKPTPSKPLEPTKTVKSTKPAPKGVADDLPIDEWMKRREAELRKQR